MENGVKVVENIDDLVVGTQVMAYVLGYTTRHINRLVEEGVLVRESPGRFNFKKNVQQYLLYLRASAILNEEKPSRRRR